MRYTETTKERVVDEEGNASLVVSKKVSKMIPPDVGAIKIWLEKRDPEHWGNKLDDMGVIPVYRLEEILDARRRAVEESKRKERDNEGD